MQDLLANKILWTAVIASLVAQIIKLFLVRAVTGRWEFGRLLETGGMPSSHSALVCGLATGIGIQYGFNSPYFSIAAVFASIVMYDATGIRRAAGTHAALLNDLVEELQAVMRDGFAPKPLKELLGHTYFEVAVGALLGIASACVSFIGFTGK